MPAAGRFVPLRRIANVAVGGVSNPMRIEDVHPDNLALAVRAVRRRHVLGRGGEAAAHGAVRMHGHALLAGVGFDGAAADAQFHLGAHQPVGNAVVVAVQVDVVVDVHAGALEAGYGYAHRRQRTQ